MNYWAKIPSVKQIEAERAWVGELIISLPTLIPHQGGHSNTLPNPRNTTEEPSSMEGNKAVIGHSPCQVSWSQKTKSSSRLTDQGRDSLEGCCIAEDYKEAWENSLKKGGLDQLSSF